MGGCVGGAISVFASTAQHVVPPFVRRMETCGRRGRRIKASPNLNNHIATHARSLDVHSRLSARLTALCRRLHPPLHRRRRRRRRRHRCRSTAYRRHRLSCGTATLQLPFRCRRLASFFRRVFLVWSPMDPSEPRRHRRERSGGDGDDGGGERRRGAVEPAQ